MTFNELTSKIDQEIAEKKAMDKNIWFDININVFGIKDQLVRYYRDKGYAIDLALCRSCQGQVADITISWSKEN